MDLVFFTNRFALALLVLGLIDCSHCAQNVTCISEANIRKSHENVCNAVGFTISDPNQQTYNIHLNYAETSDIIEVEILNQPIEYVPKQFFSIFPHIRSFTMSTNVRELRPGDFVDAMNLAELTLEQSKIKWIRTNIFSTYTTASNANTILQKLTDLSLTRNEISEIEDNSFYGMNNVERMSFSQNQLKVIYRLTFAGLPALEMLNLWKNEIEIIEDGALTFPNLGRLNLGRNKLKRLSDGIFQHAPHLHLVLLSQNGLEYIGQSLYKLSEAGNIRLNLNRIQDLDLAAFAKMPKLELLYIASNGLIFNSTEVDDGQIWNSPLTFLDIDNNNLTDFSELRKLRIFPRLETLSLGGNPYTDLGTDDHSRLKDLLPSLTLIYIRQTANMDCAKLKKIVRKLKSKGVRVIHDC